MRKNKLILCMMGGLLILSPIMAFAEPVLVQGTAQSKGQGWLFGSPQDASCWIAVPRHVIEISKNGNAADFIWKDIQGKEGIGVNPILPKDGLDLAFARVKGREAGQCLSRLGSSDLTGLVSRQPTVEAIALQKTFVQPHQMLIRSFDKTFVTFEPGNKKAKRFLKPGLSGSPLVYRSDDGLDVPVGIVTQVARDQQSGYAIRFDVVNRLFGGLGIENEPDDQTAQALFEIIESSGISETAASSSHSILNEEGCWIAKPDNEKSSYYAIIQSANQTDEYSALSVKFDETCGPAPDSILIEIPDGKSWSLTGGCNQSETSTTCHFGGRKSSKFRLTIIARDGVSRAIKTVKLAQ